MSEQKEDGTETAKAEPLPVFDLDKLLEQMNPTTFHDDVDFGLPVGQEAW